MRLHIIKICLFSIICDFWLYLLSAKKSRRDLRIYFWCSANNTNFSPYSPRFALFLSIFKIFWSIYSPFWVKTNTFLAGPLVEIFQRSSLQTVLKEKGGCPLCRPLLQSSNWPSLLGISFLSHGWGQNTEEYSEYLISVLLNRIVPN